MESIRQGHARSCLLGCESLDHVARHVFLHAFAHFFAIGVKAEVVVVDVTPTTGFLIHQSDLNLLTNTLTKIHPARTHLFGVLAGRLENDVTVSGIEDLHASLGMRTTSDQEAGIRMRDRKRCRRHRAERSIFQDFIGTDPILTLMMTTPWWTALEDVVALDRLTFEGLTLDGPSTHVAKLKTQVQVLSMAINGMHAIHTAITGAVLVVDHSL